MSGLLSGFLTRQIAASLVRHFMTTMGGVLIAKGYADDASVQALTGGAVALVGVFAGLGNKVSLAKSATR